MSNVEQATCKHGFELSNGECPLCKQEREDRKGQHCGFWCDQTPAGRCVERCVEETW